MQLHDDIHHEDTKFNVMLAWKHQDQDNVSSRPLKHLERPLVIREIALLYYLSKYYGMTHAPHICPTYV